jgi:hypothetical protein
MAALNTYRASSVGAEETLYFLDTAQTAVVADNAVTEGEFHMMFLMAESDSVETGASLETIADVTQKTQPQEATYEAVTIAYSGLFLKEDPVCKALENLYRERPVGDKSHFYIAEVDTWDKNKTYVADASIVVTNITNEAAGKRRIEATIGLASDWVTLTKAGKIDNDTGVLTFEE